MKQLFSAIVFCLLVSGLLGGTPAAHASHLLGADLTYTALGNNQYRVKYRLYQDCSGAPTTAFTLECRNGGCNTLATIMVPLVLQGTPFQPAPLCPSTPGTCQNPSSQYALYNFATYEATVTLVPGQWTMSTSQNARPILANVVSGDLYAEAYLDNSGTNVTNSSPQFDAQDIPVQYVCWRQSTTLGFSALEADGDSVVYSLSAPLQACGTGVTYLNNPNPYPIITIITNPLCVFQPSPARQQFSPTFPLPVITDTIGSCPLKLEGPLHFYFNQEARTLTFTPSRYSVNASPASGDNKYLLGMQADEYRRINGVRRLIGRIHHEMVVIVTDCIDAVPNPVVAIAQTGGTSVRTINTVDTTQIRVYACSYSRVKLDFTDPDNLRAISAHQPLTATLPTDINTNPLLLDSGDIGTFSLSGNGGEHPVGTFHFQPSAAAVGRTIRINVRIEDDACPVKARQNRVIVIKVLGGRFAVASAPGAMGGSATPTVYEGDSLALLGKALRPDSVRRLATGTTVAQTYAYRWTVRGNGLNPAHNTGPNITVAPTVTSRYFLTVTPTSGFGGCADTTSILVRVLLPPVPVPTITRNGSTLSSSAATGNQWYLNGVLIPGATGQTITATMPGTYTVRVTVVAGTGSYTTPMSGPVAITVLATQHALPGTSLMVAPNPTPDGRVSITLAGYPQPVALTVLDALGRTVAQTTAAAAGTVALDLSALPAGLYLLQVRAGAGLETRRIVRE